MGSAAQFNLGVSGMPEDFSLKFRGLRIMSRRIHRETLADFAPCTRCPHSPRNTQQKWFARMVTARCFTLTV